MAGDVDCAGAGTASCAAVGGDDIVDNTINSADILDGTITGADIAADTITAANIAADAVGSSELANNAVDTAAIQDGAVATAKLADGAVTNAKLAANAVGTANIQDGAVATAKIADGAVTNAKLAANAVGTSNIQNGAVTFAKLDAGVQAQLIANSALLDQHSATLARHEEHLSDLDAAIAMALALANIPVVPGKTFSLGMAAGTYNSEESLAVKLSWIPEKNVIVSGGLAADTRDQLSGAVGFAIGW